MAPLVEAFMIFVGVPLAAITCVSVAVAATAAAVRAVRSAPAVRTAQVVRLDERRPTTRPADAHGDRRAA